METQMGFFTKKNKKNVFDPREQYVPEVVYNDDLPTTLVKTIGIGSKDAKKVSIEYENDTLFYYFDSGVLRGIESEKTPLELYHRFYWVDKEQYDDQDLEKIVQLSDELNLVDFYQALKESYPHYVEIMTSILHNNSFQLLLSFYDEKIKSVQMEPLDQVEDQKVRNLSLMDIDARNIGVEVDKELKKQNDLMSIITESEEDITLLKVLDNTYMPKTDVERIVWAAAESGSSLANIAELSKGFLWSEILETINELNYSQRIEVIDPNRVVEESEPLPDLDLLINTETEKVESLPELEDEEPSDGEDNEKSESLSDDPFGELEEWEYSAPKNNDLKDDGGFKYNEEPIEEDITLTKHLLDDFEFNVKVAIAEEEFDRDSIVEVSSLLRKNRELEEKTVEVESKISPLQTNYDNRFTTFQHLSVNKTIDDENIVGDDVDKMRELSNRSFRELYDLEEERFNIGCERKEVLRKLEKQLINLTNENSQELLYRLNQKREAIDNIVNLAYHTPNDDENIEIDPSFLAAIVPSPEDTPMFQQLMNKYGDPFKTLVK